MKNMYPIVTRDILVGAFLTFCQKYEDISQINFFLRSKRIEFYQMGVKRTFRRLIFMGQNRIKSFKESQ